MASSSGAVAQYDQEAFAGNSCEIAAVGIFLYDTLLNMDSEIQLVWQSPKNIASLLYLFNRYLTVLWLCSDMASISSLSDTSCLAVMWLSIVTETLAMLGPAAFTTLRVWVLTGQQKWITGVALILSLGPFVVNVCTLYENHIVNSGPPVLCAESINVSTAWYITATVVSRGSQLLVDCLAIIVTWRKTYETSRTLHEALHSQALSLSSVMLNGGIVYFCSLVVLNILDVILCVLGVQGQDAVVGSYVIAFLDPLSALLVCRFLLDLRGVSERLARGSSGTGVSSLEFGGIGSRMPSIGNPSLLESLAVSVHVSPDLDEDEAALAERAEGAPDSRLSESPIA